MFSYILVVSTGNILFISISLMLKAQKMQSIGSSAILANIFKNYLKMQKYGGFYSTVQKFHWLVCIGVLSSWHCE